MDTVDVSALDRWVLGLEIPSINGRLRRYYRLTRDGRNALAEEAEVRAATARVVRVRLGLADAETAG